MIQAAVRVWEAGSVFVGSGCDCMGEGWGASGRAAELNIRRRQHKACTFHSRTHRASSLQHRSPTGCKLQAQQQSTFGPSLSQPASPADMRRTACRHAVSGGRSHAAGSGFRAAAGRLGACMPCHSGRPCMIECWPAGEHVNIMHPPYATDVCQSLSSCKLHMSQLVALSSSKLLRC